MSQPTIRVVHNLARSGGTLIAKCLGSMKNTALLSEIHPDAQIALSFNVIKQAQDWFGLDKSIHWQHPSFIDALKHIQAHCQQTEQNLLLRDWSHVDYFGVPVTTKPSMSPALINVLKPHFQIRSVQILRHPLDTWLSFRRLNLVREAGISPSEFIDGYWHYLQNTAADYQLLYENFVQNPSEELRNICQHLELNFDQEYEHKWFNFTHITGDLSNHSSLRKTSKIQPRPKKSIDHAALAELQENPTYNKILELVPEYSVI